MSENNNHLDSNYDAECCIRWWLCVQNWYGYWLIPSQTRICYVLFRCSYQIIPIVLISCLVVLIHQYRSVRLRVMDVVLCFIVETQEFQGTCRRRYFLLLSRSSWRRSSANAAICWTNIIWQSMLAFSQWIFRRLQLKLRKKVPHFFWSWSIWWICRIASIVDFRVGLCFFALLLAFNIIRL